MSTSFRRSISAVVLSGALATFASSQRADAASILSYAAGTPATTAAAGTMVTVPIYLTETDTGSSFLAAQDGLLGGGFTVAVTAGNATISSVTPNAAFTGPASAVPGTTTSSISEAVTPTATTGVAATSTGTLTDEVELGTVAITVGTLPSTLTISGFDDNTVSFNDIDFLDDTNVAAGYTGAATGTFVVSPPAVATPEPVSAAVAGGFALLTLGRRRRSVVR